MFVLFLLLQRTTADAACAAQIDLGMVWNLDSSRGKVHSEIEQSFQRRFRFLSFATSCFDMLPRNCCGWCADASSIRLFGIRFELQSSFLVRSLSFAHKCMNESIFSCSGCTEYEIPTRGGAESKRKEEREAIFVQYFFNDHRQHHILLRASTAGFAMLRRRTLWRITAL